MYEGEIVLINGQGNCCQREGDKCLIKSWYIDNPIGSELPHPFLNTECDDLIISSSNCDVLGDFGTNVLDWA